MTDKRFERLKRDPRFLPIKKKAAKVSIDPRFRAVFDENEFGSTSKDKYGRLKDTTKHNNLRRLYNLEDDADKDKDKDKEDDGKRQEDLDGEEEDSGAAVGEVDDGEDDDDHDNDDDEEEEEAKEEEFDDDRIKARRPSTFGRKRGLPVPTEEDDEVLEVNERARMIRGEGLLESSDDEEEDEEPLLDEEPELEEPEPEDTYGAYTRRFAAINMDWDFVKAKDLYKAFETFVPKGGSIVSVSIYKSELGKERLAQEEKSGPPSAIFANRSDLSKPLLSESTSEEFDELNLRKYQLERLKYYYAVAECDSVETAKAIANGCDGTEFESTANTFNLKFIPDDMTFDDEPTDVCTESVAAYERAKFITTALQHSKVQLTWDQDDPERVRVTQKKFSKDDIKDMDFKAYLASESEEEDEDEDEAAAQEAAEAVARAAAADRKGRGRSESAEERRERYKRLLLGGGEDDGAGNPFEKSKDVDMEITFTPGLTESAEKQLTTMKQRENETVFEAKMRMRREKKKAEKKQRREAAAAGSEDSDGNANADGGAPRLTAAEARRRKAADDAKTRAELELLMWDENQQQSRHFDMKDVVKAEKLASVKKLSKEQKKKLVEKPQGEFELDVQDPRFAQVHSSHLFAIDPTNSHFKKTSGMKKLLELRTKKSAMADEEKLETSTAKTIKKKETPASGNLKGLVDSVKRKSKAATAVLATGKRQKLG
ncbi:hypothetical protein DFJ73DRAFT_848304 [Zopfochytrium polystomum]|nr:hypothetical protein DFJ73DRAFT_848304 [Zopfochytrium polystomum]